MNIPYKKEYDNNGQLTNPIKGSYNSLEYPNREKRREHLNTTRFKGNHKGVSITIMRSFCYTRHRQLTVNKATGKLKTIEHYIVR